VLEKNPETVKIVFKNFPLYNKHKMAKQAALASLAAQNQGKFWQMHDALFALPQLTQKNIEKAAEKIGLNMDRFNKDVASPETKKKLSRDILIAEQIGVGGTPALFINGRQVKNSGSNTVQHMIDQEVARSKTIPAH
jgi:protein-disulfide isomerase